MRASLTKIFGNFAVAAVAAAAALLLSGCSDRSVTTESRPGPSKNAGASFVNKVWSVRESSSVAQGTLYVFLAEGTLVIASDSSRPAFGTWRYESGALTMVEEDIAYKVDILKLSKDEFRIRSHNPGEPVEITMVTADAPPLSR